MWRVEVDGRRMWFRFAEWRMAWKALRAAQRAWVNDDPPLFVKVYPTLTLRLRRGW